ncbi:hypothetical protein K458DRAFT_388802 [Lentithecium fluviatile CBS 122367]|uniref:Uncharacterized protein n=1 Tax=Lentithecium fluviatile CBS 122367 TaxID=1168545 RepID=A0A6G1J288_9PLEO|nr:hypothetical protein K458DRAFT_388802 [Lentithecium fluviatile CBS 122367]
MSAASSSTASIETPHLRRTGFAFQIPDQDIGSAARDQGPNYSLSPKPGIARHYTSLQEHADAVRGEPITPGGSSTPRAEDRREGFTWEASKNADSQSPYFHPPPTPETPPSMEEILRTRSRERETGGRVPSIISTDSCPSQESSKRLSAASSSNSTVSRSDTNRSSISGIARGVMRHVPELRTVLPIEKQAEGEEDAVIRMERRGSKLGQQLKFDLPSDPAPVQAKGTSKPANKPSEKPVSAHKGTLRERRKVAQGEAMKLTLPPNVPELPSRGRTPVVELNSLVPFRPRSPKTPCVHDHPPNWLGSGLASAPATIFEDGDPGTPGLLPGNDPIVSSQTPRAEKPGGRTRYRRSLPLRLGRTRSGRRTSEDSPRSSDGDYSVTAPLGEPIAIQHMEQAEQAHEAQTQEELKELGKRSRNRRLRWSGPWSSSGTAQPGDTPSPGRTSFSLTRMLKPKRSSQNADSSSKSSATDKALRRRKQLADMEKIANMPVPPVFVPPGTTRVTTPPTLDANGEVKGKLADFFFNIEDVQTHKPPPTPGGIWDSDAVLMPQIAGISPPTSESDESPQGIGTSPLISDDPAPGIAITTPNATYFNVPATPPIFNTVGNETWYRMSKTSPHRDSTQSTLRAAEERAKLEWLIPEHLPNSPLCPQHPKYVGPSKGVCVFHGRRQSVGSGGKGRRRESAISRSSGVLDGSGEDFGWGEDWNWGFSRSRRKKMGSGCSP